MEAVENGIKKGIIIKDVIPCGPFMTRPGPTVKMSEDADDNAQQTVVAEDHLGDSTDREYKRCDIWN